MSSNDLDIYLSDLFLKKKKNKKSGLQNRKRLYDNTSIRKKNLKF